MYEILVVDDSVLDIDCILFLIDKYKLPLHATTAVNGQEALKQLQAPGKHFDILFTDIKMPLMDGLELSRETRKLSPETRIIIFSGYNDFEYAKTAITIGVQDYLMKPIVPADFATTVNRLTAAIEEDGRQAEQTRKRSKLLKSHLLLLSVNNCLSRKDMDALPENYSHLMLVECDEEFFSQEGLDFHEKLENLLPFSFDYLNLYPTRSLLFIRESNEARYKKEAYLLSAAQTIALSAQEEYGKKCYITFDCLPERAAISAVYQRLEKKMETRFFFPERTCLLPDSSAQSVVASGHISMDILTNDLQLKDYSSLNQHLQEIFDSLKDEKTHSLIYVKYCFTELMKEITGSLPPSDRPDLVGLAERIYASSNITELISMTEALAEQLTARTEPPEQDHLKIEQIKQYLYRNYAMPLTLDEIAAAFYLSPNYLCSIFKKETGCNLIKFINDYRLHRARVLLTTTGMKVHMIAETVGFKNTSYFCQRFRDYYGESPESCRQKETRL